MDPKQDIRIVRLAPGDAKSESDHLVNFSNLVQSCEGMYPGIEKWIRGKVIPGIKTEERAAFIGYLGEHPVVSAVAKKGNDAKICHLKIADKLQNTNLGEVFFTLMGIELKPFASNIHFTLPESLWGDKHSFFESFGFKATELAETQYRLFDPELRSESSFGTMWNSILEKMPKLANMYTVGGFNLDTKLLFSIQPKYSKAILAGEKTVEIRRRFQHRWNHCRVNIYETAPTMALVGEALITGVDEDSAGKIWKKYRDQIGATHEEFLSYVGDCKKVFAVGLGDVRSYHCPMPALQIRRYLSDDLQAPQSYLTLENNKPWAQAISLAAYLHGCMPGRSLLRSSLEKQKPRITRAPVLSQYEELYLPI